VRLREVELQKPVPLDALRAAVEQHGGVLAERGN
jgi:hypothetical protein